MSRSAEYATGEREENYTYCNTYNSRKCYILLCNSISFDKGRYETQ